MFVVLVLGWQHYKVAAKSGKWLRAKFSGSGKSWRGRGRTIGLASDDQKRNARILSEAFATPSETL